MTQYLNVVGPQQSIGQAIGNYENIKKSKDASSTSDKLAMLKKKRDRIGKKFLNREGLKTKVKRVPSGREKVLNLLLKQKSNFNTRDSVETYLTKNLGYRDVTKDEINYYYELANFSTVNLSSFSLPSALISGPIKLFYVAKKTMETQFLTSDNLYMTWLFNSSIDNLEFVNALKTTYKTCYKVKSIEYCSVSYIYDEESSATIDKDNLLKNNFRECYIEDYNHLASCPEKISNADIENIVETNVNFEIAGQKFNCFDCFDDVLKRKVAIFTILPFEKKTEIINFVNAISKVSVEKGSLMRGIKSIKLGKRLLVYNHNIEATDFCPASLWLPGPMEFDVAFHIELIPELMMQELRKRINTALTKFNAEKAQYLKDKQANKNVQEPKLNVEWGLPDDFINFESLESGIRFFAVLVVLATESGDIKKYLVDDFSITTSCLNRFKILFNLTKRIITKYLDSIYGKPKLYTLKKIIEDCNDFIEAANILNNDANEKKYVNNVLDIIKGIASTINRFIINLDEIIAQIKSLKAIIKKIIQPNSNTISLEGFASYGVKECFSMMKQYRPEGYFSFLRSRLIFEGNKNVDLNNNNYLEKFVTVIQNEIDNEAVKEKEVAEIQSVALLEFLKRVKETYKDKQEEWSNFLKGLIENGEITQEEANELNF